MKAWGLAIGLGFLLVVANLLGAAMGQAARTADDIFAYGQKQRTTEPYHPISGRNNTSPDGWPGVSLRDEIAIRAMQGILSSTQGPLYAKPPFHEDVAAKSYAIADKMLAERQAKP
jgi:hypothetical protein